MSADLPVEVCDGVGIFRPDSDCRFPKAVSILVEVISQARAQGLDRILIDIRGLTGFPSPTLSERHDMVRRFAVAAGGSLRGAMVVTPDFLDPDKFGVVAAANFGLVSNAFSDEEEAMDWLRQLPGRH